MMTADDINCPWKKIGKILFKDGAPTHLYVPAAPTSTAARGRVATCSRSMGADCPPFKKFPTDRTSVLALSEPHVLPLMRNNTGKQVYVSNDRLPPG
jgi:hypothetical protein